MSCKDLLLPVQRQMVGPFAHNHLRQQAGPGDALFDRLWRLARGPHRARAGVLQAGFFDHCERGGHVFVVFTSFLANVAEIPFAPGAVLFLVREVTHDALTLQIPWKRLAAAWLLP